MALATSAPSLSASYASLHPRRPSWSSASSPCRHILICCLECPVKKGANGWFPHSIQVFEQKPLSQSRCVWIPHLRPLHPHHTLTASPSVVFMSPPAIFHLHLFVFCLGSVTQASWVGVFVLLLLYPQHLDQFLVLSGCLMITRVKSVSSFMRR